MQNPELSVVATMYRSAPYLKEFHRRTLAEIQKLGVSYEFVFVNDGSPDDSLDVALAIQKQDSHVVIVDLSRNFGHHKAIFQGLTIARGNRVFLIDSDLEEPPEILGDLNRRFSETACDVAYGAQIKRRGGLWERFSGGLFYKLFNFLADIDVPENWVIARLMTRRYVDAVLGFQEQALYLGGVLSAAGFRQVPVFFEKAHKGSSTYTLSKKIAAFITAITSFSDKPLTLVFYSGLCISMASFAYIVWLVGLRLFLGTRIDGFTTLAVSIWLIGGLIILFLGLIGIYIAKIFIQTKNRPLSIVRHVYFASSDDVPLQRRCDHRDQRSEAAPDGGRRDG